MSGFIKGENRHQTTLLPQSLDEDECLDFEWRPLDMEHVVSFAPSSVDVEISGIDTLNQEAKKKSEKIL